MRTGYYISGAGHAGLILWLLLGPVFQADPPEMQVADVSIVTTEEFAALVGNSIPAPQPAPEAAPEPAPTPPPPEPAPERPVARPDPAPEPAPAPAPEPAPEPDPAPQVDPAPAPLPVPDPEPQPVPTPEVIPEPVPQVLAPNRALRPVPRPEDRVGSEVVEAPQEDLPVAQEDTAAPVPDETAEAPAPVQEPGAREAQATEIVTEAETPAAALAPSSSIRPRQRPSQPQPAADQATQTAATDDAPATGASNEIDVTDAVNAALEEALSGGGASGPVGPPLTEGERDSLRLAVQSCWVVDVGSQASNVTVTVAMSMDRDGRVLANTLRLIGSEGGSGAAAETAFQAARRAILRCQGNGYDLPDDKYEQWKDIEMTFNPESMRLR